MNKFAGSLSLNLPGLLRLAGSLFLACSLPVLAHAAHSRVPAHGSRRGPVAVRESASAGRHMAALQHSRGHVAPVHAGTGKRGRATSKNNVITIARRGRNGRLVRASVPSHRYGERFTASSFTDNVDNLVLGDVTAGEDPLVRASLIEALGNYNGTALAIDPSNGRLLAMVNQKMALGPGSEPCSTIKVTVALAALSEGLVHADTPVSLGGSYRVNMTYALAKSVNPYFEVLGREMGFEKLKHYENQFGLGELAGYNIPGETLGVYPDHELPLAQGGVGRMCSFGESVQMTPMQLGAIVSAIANGGSLFYLQHPTTPEQIANFQPRLKRTLNIQSAIPEMLPGMAGAVNARFGTARSLRTNFTDFPVLGKTGTCSNNGTRYGWFAAYGEGPTGRIVTVFFLTGGRPTFGPKAAELTGIFYRALSNRAYFGQHPVVPIVPAKGDDDAESADTGATSPTQ
ncbi:penicillin-binding transpeptidase domain-containing protein [Terriglobus sp.]|uniref:penicillin-binding transpeptidase domain-containing protein n=1 Tax=Terriglobus sp. TaxID=1889013 RepID=UPI003AFF7C17